MTHQEEKICVKEFRTILERLSSHLEDKCQYGRCDCLEKMLELVAKFQTLNIPLQKHLDEAKAARNLRAQQLVAKSINVERVKDFALQKLFGLTN